MKKRFVFMAGACLVMGYQSAEAAVTLGAQSLSAASTSGHGSPSFASSGSTLSTFNGTVSGATVFEKSTASLTSSIAVTGLSATGGSSAEASGLGTTPIPLSADGVSNFSSSFTVDIPTTFSLSGSVTAAARYHPGPLEKVAYYLKLSSSSTGTLSEFGQSTPSPIASGFPVNITVPVSINTVLQPGQTYTLSALAESSISKDTFNVGNSYDTPATGGFNFTSTFTAVPEPTTLSALLPGALCLMARRKRRTV